MTVTFEGYLDDFKPLITCRVWQAGNALHKDVVALIDTGATDCTVRPSLAAELNLIVGEPAHTHNVGVSGLKPTTVIDLTFSKKDAVGFPTIHAVTEARTFIDEFAPGFDLILGMNVLRLAKVIFAAGVPRIIFP